MLSFQSLPCRLTAVVVVDHAKIQRVRHNVHHTLRLSIEEQRLADEFEGKPTVADALIVGSGLAGLTAALTVLDRGGRVIIFEKEPILGGNSNKASSGINACCLPQEQWNNDTLSLFRHDTVTSAGDVANINLIDTLVDNSAPAIQWLHEHVKVDLSVLSQLGGHSRQRTHRSPQGFVGAEIMQAMERAIRAYEPSGLVSIHTDTQVTKMISNDEGRVLGVISESSHGHYGRIRADHVVLATGGFASDRSSGSLLEKYRPDLLQIAATAGSFSTGDGIILGEQAGATTRDMEKIQLHPTGFVDPLDPENPNKVLAAEVLRGVGGILIDRTGHRFCNELGTRSYVTDRMSRHDVQFASSRLRWNSPSVPTFHLILSQQAALEADKHVAVYERKGLLKKVRGIGNLAKVIEVSQSSLEETFLSYKNAASNGEDEFGKTSFRGVPQDLQRETFFVGLVTPVLHYCMGGIQIDSNGSVIGRSGIAIEGLHAAGEVTGGVHGENRLGGNSLLECAVFGRIVGQNIPLDESRISQSVQVDNSVGNGPVGAISREELAQHSTTDDCWVAIHGKVFDLTAFANHHPGGTRSIQQLAGTDGTLAFDMAHHPHILDGIKHHVMGIFEAESSIKDERDVVVDEVHFDRLPKISWYDLQRHKSGTWVALFGVVYDLSQFDHPGGNFILRKSSGGDATQHYSVFHEPKKLEMIRSFAVAKLGEQAGEVTG